MLYTCMRDATQGKGNVDFTPGYHLPIIHSATRLPLH